MKLVQEYFSESAKKYPDHPAAYVWHEQKSKKISFKELEVYSNRLAGYLKDKGVKRGDHVAFLFMKVGAIDAFAAMLAILKCDAAYVPLHHNWPAERLEQVRNDAQVNFVLCRGTHRGVLEKAGFSSSSVVITDREAHLISNQDDRSLVYKNTSDNVAYILYTSGSTGTPKGVMITHGNIINATDWAVEEFGISHNDRISQHPPFSFDLSTFDIYCAFKAGATLCPVVDNLVLFPGQLLKMIEETKVTIWDSVPSVMVYLSNAGVVKEDRMPTVKKIFFNGEGFPTRFLAEWMKTFPDKEFINMYGPTETTVQCTFYRVPEPPTDLTKLVPIGKAQKGVEVFDVDGELFVAGKGVGKGYWNNPEKTAAVFIVDPRPGKTGIVYKTGDLVRLREDGNYEFIGRKDFQVKIMGNRIELGDVEAAMLALPYVAEAAAIAVPVSETDGSEIIGFVKLKEAKDESIIKMDLAKLIPSYMVPAKIIVRDSLPRTGTGKVDRNQLKDGYKA